ncbi:hypothetical protein [Luteibacter sp. UNCMF366Tsu5.1]|uniref:hypothetical protein n=1 Tax=Luteibacter sp. UNCMF366Tsu5.1 TaxID=1502758 RepID=UPI0009091BB4|nr:hypothetical protein [Luteibacter sp. UNCMF366Tsu5.1]SFW41559.1 hypothetical protein SAMN02800691_1669 [Luteibacter sp. UNCMF366Tsu5.1]
MNARPYILGCLCLVGAAGTAAASDIDPTSGLLSMGGSSASSSFEGASRSSQGNHDGGGGGYSISIRPAASPQRTAPPAPVSSPVDAGDGMHDDALPLRGSAPSWQSLLPGSML